MNKRIEVSRLIFRTRFFKSFKTSKNKVAKLSPEILTTKCVSQEP